MSGHIYTHLHIDTIILTHTTTTVTLSAHACRGLIKYNMHKAGEEWE